MDLVTGLCAQRASHYPDQGRIDQYLRQSGTVDVDDLHDLAGYDVLVRSSHLDYLGFDRDLEVGIDQWQRENLNDLVDAGGEFLYVASVNRTFSGMFILVANSPGDRRR